MADSTMNSIQDTLRKTLDNLSQENLTRFKYYLKDEGKIAWSKLTDKKTTQFETVDLIVQAYTKADSGQAVLRILKKMELNQMAEDLEKELNVETTASPSPETYRPRNMNKMAVDFGKEVYGETTEPSSTGSEVLCSLHGEKLKLFCLEDKQLLCLVCRDANAHKNHKFQPVDEAASDRKVEMRTRVRILQKSLQNLQDAKCTYDATAEHIQTQVQHTEKQIKEEFEKLHQFLRDEEAARIAALREEEEQKSEMMKEKIEKMSREISSLSDTIRAIEEEIGGDDIIFLQDYKSTVERAQCTLQDPERRSGALINVARHLGNLKFRVWEKMQEIVQYTPVTLDPNTAHPGLVLSEDLTSVRQGEKRQQLPDNPERFKHHWFVLGSEGFNAGTHCWDVEVGENTQWSVGVMAESSQRKGDFNSLSGQWFVWYKDGKYGLGSTPQPPTLLTVKQKLQRIRVQLDWDRGELSLSDPDHNILLHTLKITSTERVFPCLNTASFPLRILPVKTSVTATLH